MQYHAEYQAERASENDDQPLSRWAGADEAYLERTRSGRLIAVLGVLAAAASLIAVVGIVLAFAAFARLADRDRAEEGHALDHRMLALTALAAAPQAPFACLDVAPGDLLEGPCERAIFAGPQSVTAAISYVAARLALLGDARDYANRAKSANAWSVAEMGKALEHDRFGLVAQVLVTRYGCSAANCPGLGWFNDSSRVGGNIKEQVFEGLLAKYAASWPERTMPPPVASAAAPSRTSAGPPAPAGQSAAVGRGLDFPSADSIPPVSIMVDERQNSSRPSGDSAAPNPSAQRPSRPALRTPQATPLAPPTQLSPPTPTQ